MAILYSIKRVDLTELDAVTGLPKTTGGVKKTIKTAKEADLEPVISEGAEEVLRSPDRILAVVREDDLIYGYNLKFTDNTFDEDVAGLVAGYKVTKTGSTGQEKVGLSTPMMTEGNICKPFKMDIYVANYEGDSIVNYTKITLNKCVGKFPKMKIGKEFYAPEFEVKARENTKASLPIKNMDFVDVLPAALV